MKTRTLFALICVTMLAFTSVRCGTSTAAYLKAGSPIMSALAKMPEVSKFTESLGVPGLENVLGNVMKGDFTLLAPTNDAMNSLGASTLNSLMKPENINKLADLIKNQIIPGKLDANALMKGGLKTAGGTAVDLGTAQLGKMVSGDKFNIFPIDKLLK